MIAQLITAVKEYMPYKKRLNALSTLSNDLNYFAIVMENDWFKVSHGLLTDEEVHDLHMAMKRRINDATTKSFLLLVKFLRPAWRTRARCRRLVRCGRCRWVRLRRLTLWDARRLDGRHWGRHMRSREHTSF